MFSKKFKITAFSLCAVLIGVMVSVLVAMASSTQTISSNISINFTATDVQGKVSGTYKIGDSGTTTDMYLSDGSSTTFSFDALDSDKSGTLSPNGDVTLTRTESYVVFTYTFYSENSGGFYVKPTYTDTDSDDKNITLTYSTDNFSTTSTSATVLHVDEDTTSTYYIKVAITNVAKDATFTGSFSWSITKEEPKKPYTLVTEDDVEYVYFGEYPQTVKADSVTVGTTADEDGYYLGSDGERYAKLSATPAESSYTFSDGTTVVSGTEYYFKVEPIKWKILSESNGTALIFSEVVLQALAYQPTYTVDSSDSSIYYTTANGAPDGTYANNYKYSNLRNWLNADFYNKAFSSEEQDIIQTTTVDNSAFTVSVTNESSKTVSLSNSGYECDDTEDKVFTLSIPDLVNTNYGYSSNLGDTARQKANSDYATSSGVYIYENYGCYWSRSPYSSGSNYAYSVSGGGYLGYYYVYYTDHGAAPALNLRL